MVTYHSAAKINLFLEVEGALSDGYHCLVSVMQSVSLFDRLDFDFERRNFSLSLKNPSLDLGPVETNIITRCWRLMKDRFDLPDEVAVTVEKQIPVGAGLAGGSGNGAALLHAVNDYFQLGLSLEHLAQLGEEIGADVPFCVCGGTMLARGKGEILHSLPPLPDTDILLVNGGFPVSTANVFRRFDALPSMAEKPSVDAMIRGLELKDISIVRSCLFNDLERVTIPMYPSLTELKKRMVSLGLNSLMSGSGPTVFSLVDQDEAIRIQRCWQDSWETLFRCKPVGQGVFR